MKHVIVRYQVEPARVEENQRLVQAVFAELGETAPDGVRYATYYEGDGRFVHVASLWADGDHNPIGATSAFGRFQRDLRARCVAPPVVSEVEAVGAYPAI